MDQNQMAKILAEAGVSAPAPGGNASPSQAAAPQAPKKPATLDDLLEVAQQNKALLSNIAVNQTMLLEMEKERKRSEKIKFWIQIAKYIALAVLFWLSIVWTQKLMSGLMGGMSGMMNEAIGGGGGNKMLPDFDLSGLLNGGVDPGTQAELDRYFGK